MCKRIFHCQNRLRQALSSVREQERNLPQQFQFPLRVLLYRIQIGGGKYVTCQAGDKPGLNEGMRIYSWSIKTDRNQDITMNACLLGLPTYTTTASATLLSLRVVL